MLRRLGGCAVALVLLLPAQVVAAQPAASQPDQRAAATKTREVRLGHKPVRATTADKVRLTFKGRRGQLVNLARIDAAQQCGGRVLRTDGRVVRRWAQGFWRLPRTAMYTVVNKPCRNRDEASLRLQVRRVVREDRLVDDARVVAGANRRVTHLVPFRVGDNEVVGLHGGRLSLIHPDRSITRDIYAGRDPYTVRDYPGPVRYDVPSPRGRYFVELPPKRGVSLFTSRLHAISVDGAPVVVPEGTTDTSFTSFVFTGEAGQWVYPELTSGTGAPVAQDWMAQVTDPFGVFMDRVQVPCPASGQAGCSITQLPASGTYIIGVLTGPASEGLSVRLRSAAHAATATVNGPAVTYEATSPGRWVVGELPEQPREASGGSGTTITASNPSASLSRWHVTAVSGYGGCNPGLWTECYVLPIAVANLDPSHLSAEMPWDGFEHASVAVLAVPSDVTGSLGLALTRP